jgi:lysophospholipase L1-like esterase
MSLDDIRERLRTQPRTRIVAFGSSNTERRIEGLHWFDWLDLGLAQTYGRVHHCISAGLGGDTSGGLLARFEQDLALYRPHVVFVTIGGNDAKPDSGLAAVAFRANLLALDGLIRALGATPIFQTYYAADTEALGPDHGARFLDFMEIVRGVAAVTGAPLIDHLRRWEPVRERYPELYYSLMLDALHVNPLGNMVMGLDLLRAFAASLEPAQQAACTPGLWIQQVMDTLEVAHR